MVVLDGCSYPVFLDLLYRLTQDPELPCGLALPAATDGVLSDEARTRTGLALLPSVTSHSRGALFQGSVLKDPWVDERLWQGERLPGPGLVRRWRRGSGRLRQHEADLDGSERHRDLPVVPLLDQAERRQTRHVGMAI